MLRIESIKLTRFRGIREGELSGLADVNVLVGRNNSGKSTIPEAISLAASAVGERVRFGRNRVEAWLRARGETQQGPVFKPDCWYARDFSKPIEIRLTFPDGATRFTLGAPGHGVGHDEVPPGRQLFLQGVTTFHRFDLDNDQIEKIHWVDLFATRRDKTLVAAMKEIYGIGVEQVQLPPDGRMLLVFEKQGIALDLQGDGVRCALRSLLMLTILEKTLFTIEEPECHQHPASLERYARALCRQAKEREVQLVLTTHSTECIHAFLQGAADAGSEAAVFNLRLEDGKLDARRLNSVTAEGLESSGLDLRELDLYA